MAYFEAKERCARPLTQFGPGRDNIYELERNIVGVAQSVIEVASGRIGQGDVLLADDGLKWHRCVDLFDNVYVCHRSTGAALEFSVVERWGLKPGERCEVLVQGRDALELSLAFIVNRESTAGVASLDPRCDRTDHPQTR